MCLILLGWRAHPEFPLVVAANRDEVHHRATAAAGFWPERPQVLAGRDLVAGGTNPTVTPASGNGFNGCVLVDATARTGTQFPTFSGFVTALNTAIGGAPKLRAFGARGVFDDASTTETASGCGAIVQ